MTSYFDFETREPPRLRESELRAALLRRERRRHAALLSLAAALWQMVWGALALVVFVCVNRVAGLLLFGALSLNFAAFAAGAAVIAAKRKELLYGCC